MTRLLLSLLILLMTLSASGISSAIAAGLHDDENEAGACCPDGADDDAPGGKSDCPPLCHACACSPTFAVPTTTVRTPIRELVRNDSVDVLNQPAASPPRPGVFHPPRRAA